MTAAAGTRSGVEGACPSERASWSTRARPQGYPAAARSPPFGLAFGHITIRRELWPCPEFFLVLCLKSICTGALGKHTRYELGKSKHKPMPRSHAKNKQKKPTHKVKSRPSAAKNSTDLEVRWPSRAVKEPIWPLYR